MTDLFSPDVLLTIGLGLAGAVTGLVWRAGAKLSRIETGMDALKSLPDRVGKIETEVAGLKSKMCQPRIRRRR